MKEQQIFFGTRVFPMAWILWKYWCIFQTTDIRKKKKLLKSLRTVQYADTIHVVAACQWLAPGTDHLRQSCTVHTRKMLNDQEQLFFLWLWYKMALCQSY